MAGYEERNQEATVYVGDLDSQVGEELLWELMLQAGPVGTVLAHATLIIHLTFHSKCAHSQRQAIRRTSRLRLCGISLGRRRRLRD